MGIAPAVVFVVTYGAFLISGLLFRIDFPYYDALRKPSFTPPGSVIGIVWALLFACISLALAVLVLRVGLAGVGWLTIAVVVVNWVFNQAYAYLQFVRKDWLLSTYDAALIAVTAFAFIALTWGVSPLSAWLFLPYALWSTFATYLSYAIWKLNR